MVNIGKNLKFMKFKTIFVVLILFLTFSPAQLFAQTTSTDSVIRELEKVTGLEALPRETDNPGYKIIFNDPSGKGVELSIDGETSTKVSFPYTLPTLSIGDHVLTFKFTDKDDVSQVLEKNVAIIPRAPQLSTPEFQDSKWKLKGVGVGGGTVKIFLTNASQTYTYETTVLPSGDWEYVIEEELEPGRYVVTAIAKKNGLGSSFAETVSFEQGDSTETTAPTEQYYKISKLEDIKIENIPDILMQNPNIDYVLGGILLAGLIFGYLFGAKAAGRRIGRAEKLFKKAINGNKKNWNVTESKEQLSQSSDNERPLSTASLKEKLEARHNKVTTDTPTVSTSVDSSTTATAPTVTLTEEDNSVATTATIATTPSESDVATSEPVTPSQDAPIPILTLSESEDDSSQKTGLPASDTSQEQPSETVTEPAIEPILPASTSTTTQSEPTSELEEKITQPEESMFSKISPEEKAEAPDTLDEFDLKTATASPDATATKTTGSTSDTKSEKKTVGSFMAKLLGISFKRSKKATAKSTTKPMTPLPTESSMTEGVGEADQAKEVKLSKEDFLKTFKDKDPDDESGKETLKPTGKTEAKDDSASSISEEKVEEDKKEERTDVKSEKAEEDKPKKKEKKNAGKGKTTKSKDVETKEPAPEEPVKTELPQEKVSRNIKITLTSEE